MSDGAGGTATGNISFANRVPLAQADAVKIGPGTAIIDVLANDSDPDGDHLTIVSVSGAALGMVTTDGAKAFYTPAKAFEGVDGFDYTMSDGHGGTAKAHVSIKANYAVERSLAEQGDAIPGLPGSTWLSFGLPSIFDQGEEAGWLAKYHKSGRALTGLFTGAPDAPVLQVHTGQQATDDEAGPAKGVTFSTFQQPVFAGEDLAFVASLAGHDVIAANSKGLWVKNSTAGLRALARSHDPAAGTVGDRFSSFTNVAMPTPGIVFFTAKLANAGKDVTTKSNSGLWVWNVESGLSAALREGETLDFGGGVETLKSFQALGLVNGSPAHARYDATTGSVDARLVFTDGSQAIAAVRNDSTVEIVRMTGDTDASGRVALSFGMPSSPGGGLGPTALLTYRTTNQRSSATAVYDFDSNSVIAQRKASAPGTAGTFQTFLDPVAGLGLTNGKIIAFQASLSGVSGASNAGLWATPENSTAPVLIAQKGAVPPGASDAVYSAFESLTVTAGRGVVFVAKLRNGASRVGRSADRGCWATASDGTLRLILREGDFVAGKTLHRFDLLEDAPRSDGQRRAWADGDATPRLIYLAHFTDGTEAILTAAVP
ncbi:MAG TPA: Ig-like domain-containing protein [Urbifossiella sp.]